MTYEEIKEKYPKDFEHRSKDKLRWRYNRGESYIDLIHRIKPIIYELERRKGPVLVIGHQATIRCIYGYYAGAPINTIPTLEIPLNCLIKINPQIYGINEERYLLGDNGAFNMNNKSVIKFADKLNYVPDNILPLKDYNVKELEKLFSINSVN
jgi:broad specificity phosphatase PhoE